MERLHKSMTTYVKSLSKRNEGDDKEKVLPVAYLGQSLTAHGEDFEPDSEFGNCLIGPCLHTNSLYYVLTSIAMGRTNERVARIQETYMAQATTSWLDSLERSLVQMKDYQVCSASAPCTRQYSHFVGRAQEA
jgi:hypothetical protein